MKIEHSIMDMKESTFRLIAAIVITGAGLFIFFYNILPAGRAGHWDEVAHVIFGANIYYDLSQRDTLNLLFDVYRQVYWPPIQSVFIGAVFCFTELSFAAARSVSLMMFMAAAWTMAMTARELSTDRSATAGFLALVLTLSTPCLVLFASMAMLEMPALFFTALSLYLYARLNRPKTPEKAYMLLGIAVTLTFFAKQHFAVLLVISLLCNELIEHRFRIRPLLNRQLLYTFLPLMLSLTIWFAYPPKLISTINSLSSVTWGVENTYSLEGLLYYPKSLAGLFGSPFILSVHCFCFAVALKFFSDKRIRYLVLMSVILFAIGEIHHNKLDRHIMPMIPPMLLITSCIAADWVKKPGGLAIMVKRGLLFSFLCFTIFTVGSSFPRPVTQSYRALSDCILKMVQTNTPVLILGTMDLNLENPPMIDWQLITTTNGFDPPQAGIATASAEVQKMERVFSRISLPAPLLHVFQSIFEQNNYIRKNRSIWLGNYPHNYKSREGFDAFFRYTVNNGNYGHVIVATSESATADFPLQYVLPSLRKTGFIHKSTFRDAGNRVDEYIR